MNVTNGSAVRLTSNPGAAVGCHGVQWSPDGKKIIFAANLPQNTFLYTTNANGTDLRRVAAGDDPAWGTHAQK